MTPPPTVLEHLRAAVGPDAAGPADAALLARFAAARDEGAFELLVWRHAGTVLRVCRDVLRDHHAAEDASQAVFLALARQAGAVGRRGTVAGWLYRVALRVARRAAGRRRPARLAVDPDRLPGPAPAGDPEPARLLHEELARLPDRYRAPVLLCFFDGLSHADAACRLGWPVGTVAGRLARAKDRLRRRLSARGVTVPAAGLGGLCGALVVPPSFAGPTARAATAFAARAADVPGISNLVLGMATKEIRTMIATKIQWAACMVAVAGGLTAGGVWAAGHQPGGPDSKGTPVPPARTAPKETDEKAALAEQLAENRKLIEKFELLAKEHAELLGLANRTTTDLKRAQDDGARLKKLTDEMLRPMNEKIRRETGLPNSGPIPDVLADREVKALEGEWVVVGLEADGRKATAGEMKGMRWTFRGTEVTSTDPDGSGGKMSFRLDPAKSPKEIDLTPLDGREKGKVAAGIYRLDGGRLQVCLRDPGGAGGRPKEFVSGPGQGLITLEQAKK
jgi:RNA polymerase sigma factor (sigma-70 family)